MTCLPRSESLLTFKVLTAETGVPSPDRFPDGVVSGGGVGVFESGDTELEHAVITNRTIRNASQIFRDEIMLVRHHGDGSEDQEEDNQHENTERTAFGIKLCDVVERHGANVSQPE